MRTLSRIRAFPAPLWVLFAGTFINRFGSFVMPMLILYLTRRGYSIRESGMAVAMYGAGHFCASLLGGHLADRIGRRYTIVLSMTFSAATMLALSQARQLGLIVALVFLAGTASELYRPASHALIGDLVAEDDRVLAFGLYRFAVNLGFAAGPATAGLLADRSFTLVFVGDAITSLVYGVIAVFFLPHGLRTYRKEERAGEAVRIAARDRRFILFLAATACITTVDMQMGSTFALHVQQQGLSSTTYGLLISLNGALIILFELLVTARLQSRSPRPIIAIGYLLSGAGFALTPLAHSFPALAATVVIWTFGEIISSPMAVAFVTNLAPERYRGRYMGLWVMTWSLGMIAGPAAGTLLFERNPAIVWAGCALLGILAAALVMSITDEPPVIAANG